MNPFVKSASPLRLLRWAVAATTTGVLGLVGWYMMESREMGAHQQAAAVHTQNSLALGQLLEESAKYAQKDPSIIPLLNQLAGRAPAPASPSPAPAPNPTRR